MKYLYVNQAEDRVVSINKKSVPEVITSDCVEYIVNDSFDLTKEMTDEEGNSISLEGFLTATEFLERYNADYISQRTGAYPPIEDYLDAIVKNDTTAIEKYKSDCLAVKTRFPKG
jgi:hypothetical protein